MKTEYEEQVLSGQRCEAIKIFYNGVNYKSKLEGKWAAYFNYLGVGFGYKEQFSSIGVSIITPSDIGE